MLSCMPFTARRAVVLFTLVIALAGAATGCGGDAAPETPPPPTVTVATPVRQTVTEYYRYTGTLEATETVDVRARVAGRLEATHFTASTDVKQGDLLFEIEPQEYEIAVTSARAGLAGTAALLEQAQVQDKIVRGAFDQGAATEQERLLNDATLKQRESEQSAAESMLAEAQRRLNYTRVEAPIDGRVSRTLVDVGNLVGENEATVLTRVVRLDPMYVYFDVSERIVLEYLERGRNGGVGEEREPPVIEIERANDEAGSFPFRGVIDYVSPGVDVQTGTIRVRGRLDNPERRLFPGLFVRIRAPYATIEDAVLIEQVAVGQALGGPFVLLVGDDGTVEQRPVELGETDGALVRVASGLEGGERYITAGIQKARPGQKVQTTTADDAADDTESEAKADAGDGGKTNPSDDPAAATPDAPATPKAED